MARQVDVTINESIVSLLIKLHNKLSDQDGSYTPLSIRGEMFDDKDMVGDGPFFVARVLDSLCAKDVKYSTAVEKVYKDLLPKASADANSSSAKWVDNTTCVSVDCKVDFCFMTSSYRSENIGIVGVYRLTTAKPKFAEVIRILVDYLHFYHSLNRKKKRAQDRQKKMMEKMAKMQNKFMDKIEKTMSKEGKYLNSSLWVNLLSIIHIFSFLLITKFTVSALWVDSALL